MSEVKALINLGELSKPATVLIEKISDAIGGIFRPWQIRRVAQAEAEAEKALAVSRIEITALQRRAVKRFLVEEAKKQDNIETITEKALPQLQEAASPEKVEDDWITNFFDKCRLISDDEMQTLWARVLAGEANSPGHYSKRTVHLLSTLDKSDAQLFRSLCSFGWWLVDVFVPLVFDVQDKMYNDAGIDYDSLKHLERIGLLSFETGGYLMRTALPEKITPVYYGQPVEIVFLESQKRDLQVGVVHLSKPGLELVPVCGFAPRTGFREYTIAKWKSVGLRVNDPAEVTEAVPHTGLSPS